MKNNRVSRLDNQSSTTLIDELGKVKAKLSDLFDEEEDLKGELIKRLGVGTAAEGRLFRITISERKSTHLNKDRIGRAILKAGLATKATLEAWLRRHSTKSESVVVYVKARTMRKAA